jgi:hypothetical protein
MKLFSLILTMAIGATTASVVHATVIPSPFYRKICQQEQAGTMFHPPVTHNPCSYFLKEEKLSSLKPVVGGPVIRCYVSIDPITYRYLMRELNKWIEQKITIEQAIENVRNSQNNNENEDRGLTPKRKEIIEQVITDFYEVKKITSLTKIQEELKKEHSFFEKLFNEQDKGEHQQ